MTSFSIPVNAAASHAMAGAVAPSSRASAGQAADGANAGGGGGDGFEADKLDAELVALPAPPRHEKMLAVAALLLVAVFSCAFAFTLRADMAYALRSSAQVDLGDLGRAQATDWRSNTFAHARATLGAADALRYERPFTDGSFRLAPVLGRSDVWVELKVPPKSENARFVAPSEFSGRLVRFSDVGSRHRGLATAIAAAAVGEFGAANQVPAGWLLVADEAPSEARWSVAVFALCVAFAMFCAATIRKLTRRVGA